MISGLKSRVPAGLLLCGTAFLLYAARGYSVYFLIPWLAGIAAIAFSLAGPSDRELWKRLSWVELRPAVLLLLVFAPIYLAFLYQIPVQVNTDEIVIGNAARAYANPFSNTDPLGPSSYFNFPAFIFILFGRIAQLFGGIDFERMRWVHAGFGLLIAVPAYACFRILMPRWPAVLASALVLSQHALLAVSRMVNRNNVAVLNELAAFAFLFYGQKSRSRLYMFLGGAIAGGSFYHYPPARLIFFVWAAGYVAAAVFARPRLPKRISINLFLAALAGYLLVILPMCIASAKPTPLDDRYGKQQILLFRDGRQHQAFWYKVSEREAFWINIKQGFAMFNSRRPDQANIYPNPGHGFLDPVSGVLLWIGLVITLRRLIRKVAEPEDVMFAVGFFMLWFVYMFVLNQAPNYTRLFLVIPFVAFFVLRGAQWLGDLLSKLSGVLAGLDVAPRKWMAGVAIGVALLNLSIFGDFVQTGMASGNDVGGTGRYITARAHLPTHAFFIVTDAQHPYYSWGSDSAWRSWAQFYATPSQRVDIIAPSQLWDPITQYPLTLFMSAVVWDEYSAMLTTLYPRCRITPIKTDGSLLAFEVRS